MLFVFVLPAEAAKLHTYPEQRVTWDTNSGKIIHRSVCDNYTKGSLQYRACRRKAKMVFKDRCQTYEMKFDRFQKEKRKTLRPENICIVTLQETFVFDA